MYKLFSIRSKFWAIYYSNHIKEKNNILFLGKKIIRHSKYDVINFLYQIQMLVYNKTKSYWI